MALQYCTDRYRDVKTAHALIKSNVLYYTMSMLGRNSKKNAGQERDTAIIFVTVPPVSGQLATMKTSLVSRPFERRRKGLVHTVCACVNFSVKLSVKLSVMFTATRIIYGKCVMKSVFIARVRERPFIKPVMYTRRPKSLCSCFLEQTSKLQHSNHEDKGWLYGQYTI